MSHVPSRLTAAVLLLQCRRTSLRSAADCCRQAGDLPFRKGGSDHHPSNGHNVPPLLCRPAFRAEVKKLRGRCSRQRTRHDTPYCFRYLCIRIYSQPAQSPGEHNAGHKCISVTTCSPVMYMVTLLCVVCGKHPFKFSTGTARLCMGPLSAHRYRRPARPSTHSAEHSVSSAASGRPSHPGV